MKHYLLPAAVVLSLAAPAALAHHSFAMFDTDKRVLLDATVKEVQWTNPHAWLQIMVPMPGGQEVEWSIEMASPNAMYRGGWRRDSMKPGDKVKVMTSPLRDGRPGGSLVNATLADGTKMGRHEDQAGQPILPTTTLEEHAKTMMK